MPSRLLSFAQQAFRPLLEIVDVTELLLCRPREAARILVKNASSKRAVAYFLSSFSLAVILNRVGFYALGLESISDFPYWAFHAGVVFAAALAGLIVARGLQTVSPPAVLNAYFWSYGTSFVLGTMFLAGTSLTILAAHELGYIPSVAIDLALFSNTTAAFDTLYSSVFAECRRAESVAFAALYHAFYGALESVHKPIDALSYVLPASYVLGLGLSAIQIYHVSSRAAVLSTVLIGLSAIVIFLSVFFAAVAYARWNEKHSACTPESIVNTAYRMSAEDYVRGLVSKLSHNVGKQIGPGVAIKNVEADRSTVIIHVEASREHMSEDGFQRWVEMVRAQKVHDYCTSHWGDTYRNVGITQVYLLKLAGTEKVERVIQSPDACRR
jgi:hypothetical protein